MLFKPKPKRPNVYLVECPIRENAPDSATNIYKPTGHNFRQGYQIIKLYNGLERFSHVLFGDG